VTVAEMGLRYKKELLAMKKTGSILENALAHIYRLQDFQRDREA
jgi:hypothetical protein